MISTTDMVSATVKNNVTYCALFLFIVGPNVSRDGSQDKVFV